ncbi:MAG: polymerase sigma factor, sigma-70 family [Geminicoccaceae bacterium]|nr:polymerase sigma factor, sigma-70 family [Geminicoccaceae bacterium]
MSRDRIPDSPPLNIHPVRSPVDSPEATAPTDADLVAAARAAPGGTTGAGDAFGILVTRYQPMVFALAVSLVGEPADASDVAQEAFLRAFRNLDLLADPSKFGAWLRRITFGVSIDHVRAERARVDGRRWAVESPSGGVVLDGRPSDAMDRVPAPQRSPLERLEDAEVVARVLAALDQLPARYRVPFTLFHVDGLSHAKVAAALGVAEGTARSLVTRARRKLTTLLASSPEIRDTAHEARIPNVLDVFDAAPRHTPRQLHVLNGDAVRMTLERSDVPGAFAPYADVLHDGPVPAATDTAAWRETRARFIASCGYVTYADALRTYEDWDAQVRRFAQYDEVILWFEHDLFDQLLLVRHLDWFSRRDLGRTRLSLICVGEFPGFADFHGLGQLDANQLASLLGTRAPVSPRQLVVGRQVWEAFTRAHPRDLEGLVRMEEDLADALPFLPGALRRFLEEYPSVEHGLPRTERHILECLVDGPLAPAQLFRLEQKREERVFMGDWTFWTRVRSLASERAPLVRLETDPAAGPGLPSGTVSITEAGRDVLAGRSDWIRLAGFDRWLGGVHLMAPPGGDVRWRYDAVADRLVARGGG